jgi:NADPH-dependent 2,4-dienoyl-CoA reductase/sulfur reductase-like enzyme
MTQYVIIGNSVAGTRAATVIRTADPLGEITILTADAQPFYLRPKLADYVAGKTAVSALAGRKPDFYTTNRVNLRLSARVIGVDTKARRVLIDQSEPLGYDQLLIASGARPTRDSFPGSDMGGVLSLKTIADAEALKARLATAKHVVVVGEGLMGLEMARACRAAGAQVTYLVKGRSFWPALLDEDAANLVEQRLIDSGVELRRGVSLREAVGSEGQVRYVLTSRGAKLPCDLLCVGAGLQPDTEFLQGSGIAVDNGIIVNQQLQTRVAGVFAAGDCVQQHAGHDFGWLRAWEQGAARPTPTFRCSPCKPSASTCWRSARPIREARPTAALAATRRKWASTSDSPSRAMPS